MLFSAHLRAVRLSQIVIGQRCAEVSGCMALLRLHTKNKIESPEKSLSRARIEGISGARMATAGTGFPGGLVWAHPGSVRAHPRVRQLLGIPRTPFELYLS